MTPLMYACADGNEALSKTLIEYHALLDTQVKSTSLLSFFCNDERYSNLECLKLFFLLLCGKGAEQPANLSAT